MASERARHGKRIASRACDVCRIRKCQCVFDDNAVNCRKCTRLDLKCTFLTDRKTRGPRAHRFPHELPQLMGAIYVEQFCPPEMLHRLIRDFDQFVYPLAPLVHKPDLWTSLHREEYKTKPRFFRRCLALCAITAASIPRNEAEYCGEVYSSLQSMVDRACDLVLLSRLATEPAWQDNADLDLIIDSTLLAMASHYTERPIRGWSFLTEAIVALRTLQLHRPEGYAAMSVIDTELGKRAFWILHTLQVYDRLDSVAPYTIVSFPPFDTDWRFMKLLLASDEQLSQARDFNGLTKLSSTVELDTPILAGFVGLIRVFTCLRNVLSSDVSLCLQDHLLYEGDFGLSIPPAKFGENWRKTRFNPHQSLHSSLQAARKMRTMFSTALQDFPAELQFPMPTLSGLHREDMHQFDVARATLHITSLYMQSTLVESIFRFSSHPPSGLEGTSSTGSPMVRTDPLPSSVMNEHISTLAPELTSRAVLWSLREEIVRDLLDVLDQTSSQTLERNGFSLVQQIRKVAATLLDGEGDHEPGDRSRERMTMYVQRFTEILANLDHIPSYIRQEQLAI